MSFSLPLFSRAGLLLAALLFAPAALAQPEVFYPFGIGAAGNQNGVAVAVGADGSAFVAGDFTGSPDFDPSGETLTLTAAGQFDVYLARYDENGALVWAFSLGSPLLEVVGGAATADGGVVVVGEFDGSFDADPGSGEMLLTSVGSSDLFVAKYDAEDGAFLWAFSVGSTATDAATAVAAGDDGGIVVAGLFNSAADFDPGAGTTPLISAGGSDAFAAEYDADGVFVQAFRVGGGGNDEATGVALGDDGGIALAGTFQETANFDPDGSAEATAPSGATNAFVAAYDTDGAFRWVTPLLSGDNNDVAAVAADGEGNVVATGRLAASTTLGDVTLTPESAFDLYVAKLGEDGAARWAFNVGGFSAGLGLATAGDGEVVVTGSFTGSADFDPGDGTTTLTGVDGPEIFVARYRADGSFRWAFAVAAEGFNQGRAVAVDDDGNALVVGDFGAAKGIDFDPSPDNAITLFSQGGADAFVAKYDEDGTVWEPKTPANELAAGAVGARLSAPFPNPVRGRASLALALEQPQDVRVEVFDTLGRRVAGLQDGPLAAGDHTLALDAAGLPSGLYVVRAVGDAFALSTRTTVVQ